MSAGTSSKLDARIAEAIYREDLGATRARCDKYPAKCSTGSYTASAPPHLLGLVG